MFKNRWNARIRSGALRWAAGAACAAALVAGWVHGPGASAAASVAQDGPAGPAAPGTFKPSAAQWKTLQVKPAQSMVFDAVVTTDGTVALNDNATVNVYSQFSGRVTAVHVQAGQAVRKGAPLMSLAATESAQVRSDLAAATAAAATARQQLALARATERRQQELFKAEAGAEKDWQQARSDRVAAEGALQTTEAAARAAQARAAVLGGPGGDRAGVTDGALVTAPTDGIVVLRQVAPGQFVNSLAAGGSTPLFTISDLRHPWLLGNVAEADAAKVHVDQPVDIGGPALGHRTLRGRVSWIASTLDPASHRVSFRAELPQAEEALKPQMSLTLRVLEAHPKASLAVPRSSLVVEGAQAHCYVAQADHTLIARKVQLGRIQGPWAEVTGGLSPGEAVVTRGALFIDSAAQDDTP